MQPLSWVCLNGRFGLGLFDVCPSADERGRREGAGGQTLNKPRRRKPRNAARRPGKGTAYGVLKLASYAEKVIVRCPGPSVWRKRMPVPAHIVAWALVGGDEIRRFGVDKQQSALGTGSPEADTGE